LPFLADRTNGRAYVKCFLRPLYCG